MRIGLRGFVSVAVIAAFVMPSAASATTIKEFPLSASSDPLGIAAGPDGNLWFTDGGTTSAIGRVTPAGVIKEFTGPFKSTGKPADITLGPDGNMWFTTTGSPANAIGKVTPSGQVTEYQTGLNPSSAPSAITVGPDGNLWFLDNGVTQAIGRVKTDGTINEFPVPDLSANLEDLTAGPDGNMWFTDRGNTRGIGRVTPSGMITEFTGTLNQIDSQPNGITAGADGNLWFTDEGSPTAVGRATASATSTLTEFMGGLQTGAQPDGITAGADGNVWFEDNYSGQRAVGQIKPSGAIHEFTKGLGTGTQDDITLGPDGNVWIEQSTPGGVARITPAGTITQFTKGLLPGAGADGDQLATGPDGNLWFTDRGAKAIARVSLELPPTARTGSTSKLSFGTVTLAGSVTPLGASAKVKFEYGKSRKLGSTAGAMTAQASTNAVAVQAVLARLPPSTVIYYRVVASNPFGTATGQTRSFRTKAGHVTKATLGNRRITLVTPGTASCVSTTLYAFLSSAHRSHGKKLRFTGATFYLGSKKRATARRLPAAVGLALAGVKAGSKQLKVVVRYSGGRSKTFKARFRVC